MWAFHLHPQDSWHITVFNIGQKWEPPNLYFTGYDQVDTSHLLMYHQWWMNVPDFIFKNRIVGNVQRPPMTQARPRTHAASGAVTFRLMTMRPQPWLRAVQIGIRKLLGVSNPGHFTPQWSWTSKRTWLILVGNKVQKFLGGHCMWIWNEDYIEIVCGNFKLKGINAKIGHWL